MRAQATGYAGDPNARTPNLDALAGESVNFTQAVSGCPVCSPARASLLTGQYPLTHGVFVNDVQIPLDTPKLAEVLQSAGYDTGYIGKWHVDGHGRLAYTPPERRCGFDFWRAVECTHRYNDSLYYADDDPTPRRWGGYDAIRQTDEACRYIEAHAEGDRPFLLMLSWGTPHNPYETAPEEYRQRFDPRAIQLRPNVPEEQAEKARQELAGYYAHIAAIDDCVGRLLATLDRAAAAEDTIFVFWSDHGDMLGCHGHQRKQRPWEESIRVPLLIRYPRGLGEGGRGVPAAIDAPDLMPTLLALAGVAVPDSCEGRDFSPCCRGSGPPPQEAALLGCYHPFGEYYRDCPDAREYRGLRTERYTYCRDRNGPWLLYDNAEDPYQLTNLVGRGDYADIEEDLDRRLLARLAELGDALEPGPVLMKRYGYPYMPRNFAVPCPPEKGYQELIAEGWTAGELHRGG